MPSKLKIIPYNPELKVLAKELRKNMTISEVLLWNELRNKQIRGYDFDRQRPIDNFIVDSYSKELMLAIEIDGGTHIYRYDYDEDREMRLESLGIRFLRDNLSREGSTENETLSLKNKKLSTKLEPTPDPSEGGEP